MCLGKKEKDLRKKKPYYHQIYFINRKHIHNKKTLTFKILISHDINISTKHVVLVRVLLLWTDTMTKASLLFFLLHIFLNYISNAIPKVPHIPPPPLPCPPTLPFWPWCSPLLGHIKLASPMGLSFQ